MAAAAAVLLAVGVGWSVVQDRRASEPVAQIAATSVAGAFAELVTPAGREKLSLGRPFATGDTPREVLLGGQHRVVMNAQTAATFRARAVKAATNAAARHPAYDIDLANGEVYVEVVPGHPFTVRTTTAVLTVTGTKFGVRAEPGRTDVVLAHVRHFGMMRRG